MDGPRILRAQEGKLPIVDRECREELDEPRTFEGGRMATRGKVQERERQASSKWWGGIVTHSFWRSAKALG